MSPNIRTEMMGSERWYVHPTTGTKVPSVTTALGIIDKPALMYWAAGEVAMFAIQHKEAWTNLPDAAALQLLKGVPWQRRNRAGDTGTNAHEYAEALLSGRARVDQSIAEATQSNDLLMGEGYAEACEGVRQLVKALDPEVVATELTCWSHKYGYAGTFDGLLRIKPFGLCLVDWKTSKDVYPDMGVQLAAYRYADEIVTATGKSFDMPKVDQCLILHIPKKAGQPAGVVPVRAGEEEHEAFLGALDVYRWKTLHSSASLGQRLTPEQFIEWREHNK